MVLTPQLPSNEEELEALLSLPTERDVEAARSLAGDLILLGAGGKMGPSLAGRAKHALLRAGSKARVLSVVRKDRDGLGARLAREGVELVEADLLSPDAINQLPDAANVVFMVGRKFGSTSDQSLTWATNAWSAGLLAYRYRKSRIVVFSTGNVYPFVDTHSKGATEETPVAPVGEYAQSTLARERIFEYFANQYGTKILQFRLNYANDLRYGVLTDIAQRVFEGTPTDLTVGYANVIWQGDANGYVLRSFALCNAPAEVLNVTGPETISVREIAARFGEAFQKTPVFKGTEAATALLSNSAKCIARLGPPSVSLEQMIKMVAHWFGQGGPLLGKPTKFDRNDGAF